MRVHDEETAGLEFADALTRAGELLDEGATVLQVMDTLDEEWRGSTIWPSASANLWTAVERLACQAVSS